MSTKPNHRRGEGRKQDNGSTYEGDPNDGGGGVRRARRNWKRIHARHERRTGRVRKVNVTGGSPSKLPKD